MKWIKAPEALKATIEKIMQGIDCEKRPMFGYPAYFINGNMFSGLFQTFLFLRLSPAQVSSLKAKFPSVAPLEPMPGRPMKDYFTIPEALYSDEKKIKLILQEAVDYARTLPAKAKKPRKTRKTGS